MKTAARAFSILNLLFLIGCSGTDLKPPQENSSTMHNSALSNNVMFNSDANDDKNILDENLTEDAGKIVNEFISNTPRRLTFQLLDWNKLSDNAICAALRVHKNIIVGTQFVPGETDSNGHHLQELEAIITRDFSDAFEILDREKRLAILTLNVKDCSSLGALRKLPQVIFVDPEYTLPVVPEDLFDFVIDLGKDYDIDFDYSNHPLYFDSDSNEESYREYIAQGKRSRSTSSVMKDHRLDKIYNTYDFFGNPEVGVAVLDNGVTHNAFDYLSISDNFEAEGFYRPEADMPADGIHPKEDDFFWASQIVKSIPRHGAGMLNNIFQIAPDLTLRSTRVTEMFYWYKPEQFHSVTNAILHLAEDPDIRVISASQGTIIHNHRIERAIQYFNAFDKIYVSAGGSSLPFMKRFIGIGFPANLDSTVSATGIKDLSKTDGAWKLGHHAHGGPQNDFVVEGQKASSPSAAYTAGMIGLIWSINPDLNRVDIINIMKESSTFYLKDQEKHPVYGWGKIDAHMAFEKALNKESDLPSVW